MNSTVREILAGTLPVINVLPEVAANIENGDMVIEITTSIITRSEILLFIILLFTM